MSSARKMRTKTPTAIALKNRVKIFLGEILPCLMSVLEYMDKTRQEKSTKSNFSVEKTFQPMISLQWYTQFTERDLCFNPF